MPRQSSPKSRSLIGLLLVVSAFGCANERSPRRRERLADDDDDRRSSSATSSATPDLSELFGVFRGDEVASASTSAATTTAAQTIHVEPVGSSSPVRPPRPRLDPETEKRYRAEVCLVSARLLELSMQGYFKSLDGRAPSLGKLPLLNGFRAASSFGSSGHGCRSAIGSSSAKVSSIDGELKAVSEDADTVSKTLRAAMKYYEKETYNTDSFAEGKALHTTLLGQAGLRAQRVALQNAVDNWLATLPPPDSSAWSTEQIALRDVISTSQKLSRLMMASPLELKEIERGTSLLEAQVATLGKTEGETQGRYLRSLALRAAEAAREFARSNGSDLVKQIEALVAYARLVEAERRWAEQRLAPDEGPSRPPLLPKR